MQVFWGATDLVLDKRDVRYPMEADAEILGTGAVTTFMIVTPMILLAYVIEGRKAIQASFIFGCLCSVVNCGCKKSPEMASKIKNLIVY